MKIDLPCNEEDYKYERKLLVLEIKEISNWRINNMNMTSEQKNLLATLMNNKAVLEELMKVASIQQKQAKDLKMKESITIAGSTWSKFAEDSKRNSYMLADGTIWNMKFGNNNDWRESLIRKKLNAEFYYNIVAELGQDALVTIHTDLFSHDGLRDYGKCEDMISIPTYDLYRNNRENIKCLCQHWWTCTPNSTPLGDNFQGVQFVAAGGYVHYRDCSYGGDVRPFII